jgi:hypothetical protein
MKADSTIQGWQAAGHIEFGWNGYLSPSCGMRWFGAEPFIMGDWVGNWEQAFREHGAGSFNMGQNGRFCSLLRGETGFRLHEIASLESGARFVFREKFSYVYQKAFKTGAITAYLVGSPGSFTVSTLTGAVNLGAFEFSMLSLPANRKMPYLDIRYQGEFGMNYLSQQVIVEIGKCF